MVILTLALVAAGACAEEADEAPFGTAEPSGTADAGGGPGNNTGGTTLAWESCGGDAECAVLEVPVDYDDPEGPTLPVDVARVPADEDRIGALFLNPGGPGGSATQFAVGMAAQLPSEITDRFDIVGVEPRGLGASAIDCGVDVTELYSLDYTIDSPQDQEEVLDVSQDYVEACEAEAGDLLPHLGTENVARDIDRVRAAMGDEKANFLMMSYGTAIAQVYADLFPERVRAMAIDGIVDLEATGIEAATTQAIGFENALAAFIEDCNGDDSCPLGPDAAEAIDELIARVEEEPIDASPRDLGPGELSTGMGYPLYNEMFWPSLASAVDDALEGDGSAMVELADAYVSGASFDIYFAVNCIDFAWPEGPEQLLAAGEAAAEQAPHFGESIVNDYVRCPLWPAENEPLEPVTAAGAPPILVIATTNDPATPYQSAERTAERLEDAVLLTYEGEGHGIAGQGVPCIDEALVGYLVDLELPEDGTVC